MKDFVQTGCAFCHKPFTIRVKNGRPRVTAFRTDSDRYLYCSKEHAEIGVDQQLEALGGRVS